ncbi:MAG: chemoreceptor glutamine deamidase CheD [Myxococcales bacterium]|nr:chemoreceptor glutamine deamidase CheD [Myxococcales bacterium]
MTLSAEQSAGESYSESWDPKSRRDVLRVLPGGYCVTQGSQLITTVLGSCVAACIRDPQARVGGINHFMLPEAPEDNGRGMWGGLSGSEARYGDFAMECLINELMARGAIRGRMQVKIFGGGDVMGEEKRGASLARSVGTRNVAFVRRFLENEGFSVLSEDVGGRCARSVRYLPVTGQVWIKHMEHRTCAEEVEYRRRLRKERMETNDVEFF